MAKVYPDCSQGSTLYLAIVVCTWSSDLFLVSLQHLTQQQGALSEMIKIMKQDFQDLKTVEDGLKNMEQSL